jgi:glycosyltransferase involved in cell wall biosynthesis
MKILFVNHSSTLTGAAISCYNLIDSLGNGFEPVFAARTEGPVIQRLRERGVTCHIVDDKGPLGLRYIKAFTGIIKREGVDLVHLNTLTPFCKYAGIAAALRRLPVVWFVRENPLISRSRRLGFWLRRLASRIVFVDDRTRENLMGDSAREKVKVIHNGVNLDSFRPEESDYLQRRLGIGDYRRLIGYIGLITNRKGIRHLVESMPLILKEDGRALMVIIGGHMNDEEDYYRGIRELVKDLSLEGDIYFTGEIEEIGKAINSLDIVVLPSLEERCSRTLLEAMACGKPSVATGVGGTPELIEDGVNGLLVRPEDPAEIAGAVLRLLRDDGLFKTMGANGRRRAEERFDIRENTKRIRDIYLGLCNR